MTTPADIDRAVLLAWLEEEQKRTLAEADEATQAHLRQLFEEDHEPAAGRRQSQLVGRYIALVEVARRIRAGEFDRRQSE